MAASASSVSVSVARPALLRPARSAKCFSKATPAHQNRMTRRISPATTAAAHRRSVAAAAAAASETSAVASPGDYLEVDYVVYTEDGTEVDSSKESGQQACFILGSSRLVAGFHQAVGGLAVGESRRFKVSPEDAYGERSDEMVAKLPRSAAPEGLEAGVAVKLSNGMTAVVTAVDEDSVTIDANHPLAGQALDFEVTLTKRTPAAQLQAATFGAGCFWGVELAFQRVPGVVQTEVGYSQGEPPKVTYEQVCSGTTGHNEVVQVVYDEKEVSYEALLDVFWSRHDPTTLNRQGGDVGTQYRSGVYWHTEEQRRVAEASLAAQNEKLGGKVVTELQQVKNYCPAEEHHQAYLAKGGRFGQAQSPAKGCNDPIRCYG